MLKIKTYHQNIFIYLSALTICFSGIIILQNNHAKSLQNQTVNYLQEEQNHKSLLRWQTLFPSLSFNNLKADWIFLHFVQYFGDKKARDKIGYELVPDYFNTIVESDPHFTEAYLNLSIANTIYAGKPEQTITLMNQVLNSMPATVSERADLLWMAKGLDELLFVGDNQAAKKSYQMAAQWANRQDNELGQNRAKFYLQTAQFLATDPDNTEVQINSWKMILPNLKKESTKQEVIDKIQALETQLKLQQKHNSSQQSTDKGN